MRYLAFLFTIYIMALLAWPCCSNETSLSSSHDDVCLTGSEHQNDNHDSPRACSPFFHATTYHAFVASSAKTKAPDLFSAEQNRSYPKYKDMAITVFSGEIWQPPQLG